MPSEGEGVLAVGEVADARAPNSPGMYRRRIRAALTLLLLIGLNVAAITVFDVVPSRYASWEPRVIEYEKQDELAPPPKGGVVFVGSSSIQRWDLPTYFPSMGSSAINRGISGSSMPDAFRYVSRLVTPYAPRVVVVYAGDNDLDLGYSAEEIAAMFAAFEKSVHQALPQTRIVVISVKPSVLRWSSIDTIRHVNQLMKQYCAAHADAVFLDIERQMLGPDGKPRAELFQADGLHLSAAGYRIWTDALAPLLD
jgi:lysophospholipase L1-like esterase